MHGRFDIKLGAQVRFHVPNHLLSIGGAKQIGFADEHHRTRAGLIKRVHHDQIILGKACARVDQNDAQMHRGRYAMVSSAPATASEPTPGVSTKVTPSASRSDGSFTKMRVTCFLLPGFFCSVANSGSSDNGMICGCASANSIPASATGPWLMRVGIAVTGVTPIGNTSVCKM